MLVRRIIPLCAFGVLASQTVSALQQPDGTVIPQTNNLVDFLNGEGETIDPLTEAAVTPETFTVGCTLTFKVIGRGGSMKNSFGWYNVTGSKPAMNELYQFLGCNDDVGVERDLNIAADSRWTGGPIGFYQATPEDASGNCPDVSNPSSVGYVYYSERGYNGDGDIHLLIMDSKAFPNAFYFGWEDLVTGGDNDFEDLLTRVSGIRCTGGGEPCDTGERGKCANGATQCINGKIECVQLQQPGEEQCNALDDDCNGLVDDGVLCNDDWVCDRGVCRPPCGNSEFPCGGGLVCSSNNLCVEHDCLDVACPTEQVCVSGECVGACDEVVCPHDQVCRQGHCVDPCGGVVCEDEYVCQDGVCVVDCLCVGCEGASPNSVCDAVSKICVDAGCDATTCDATSHCENGDCVDNCEGAVCPNGEVCEAGDCVQDATGSAGGGGASGNSGAGGGSSSPIDTGDGSPSGGDDGSGLGNDGTWNAEQGKVTPGASGCGCRAAGFGGANGLVPGLAGLLLVGLWQRRRRRPATL